jgi:predicted enzyme related to lactoylglutathione lyase/L-rhamnose mutarotase
VPRYLFLSPLDPPHLDADRARHAAVREELLAALRDAGWRRCALFVSGTGVLVGYVEAGDKDLAQARAAATDVGARWRAGTAGPPAGGGAGEGSAHLPEVFHLDDQPRAAGLPATGPSAAPLRDVDAVTVPVPDLDAGIACYGTALGHRLLWRDDATGQAGLGLAEGGTELVLTTRLPYEPDWLVDDVEAAAARFVAAGGRLVDRPRELPVGRVAVVADPFGNRLVLVELSRGRYVTDAEGRVTGVGAPPGAAPSG